MKRSPLKRGAAPKRRTPLRQRSAKRARSDKRWSLVRDVLLVTRPYCQAAGYIAGSCAGTRHVHHVLRRAQGGPDVPENLVVVCAAHHRAIHANPKAAVAAGLLRYRWEQ